MRNISFALTIVPFYRRRKTVTRRLGWIDLKPHELKENPGLLCGVNKGMGLQKGESPLPLAIIAVIDVRRERLNEITQEDVELEGFPGMSRRDFITMFCKSHESCEPRSPVTRIEYRFVPGGRFLVPGFCRICGCSEYDACEPDMHGETCGWVNDKGLLSKQPTTLCSRCHLVSMFGQD